MIIECKGCQNQDLLLYTPIIIFSYIVLQLASRGLKLESARTQPMYINHSVIEVV